MEPWIHPETREGEIFLTNVGYNEDELMALREWKSARRGTQAYTILRQPIEGEDLTPVFVSLAEYRERYGTIYD